MTIHKKLLLTLLLLFSVMLLQRGVSAQRNPRLQMNQATTDRVTLPPAEQTADRNKEVNKKVKESFSEALDAIRKNHVDAKSLSYNHLFKSAITGMLKTLDPHSKYYDAKDSDALLQRPRGSAGIGITIVERKIGDETGMFVLASAPQSNAATAGLRFGDRITAVDNWEVKVTPWKRCAPGSSACPVLRSSSPLNALLTTAHKLLRLRALSH